MLFRSLVFPLSGKWQFLILPIIIASLGTFTIIQQGAIRGICDLESNYFCIRIVESEQDGDQIQTMILDKLVHSITNLDDPENNQVQNGKAKAKSAEVLENRR